MSLCESLIAEVRQEAAITRRMMERAPQDSLAWRPHAKSRTLGEIVLHLANLPGLFLAPLGKDGFDRTQLQVVDPERLEAVLEAFDRHVASGLETLATLSDEQMLQPWRYSYGDRLVFEAPRLAVLRGMGLNHLIHHRGQLSVYLRLLDVPLPPVYGPTADEAAFS